MERRDFFKVLGVLASVPLLSKSARAEKRDVGYKDMKKETPIAVIYHCDFPQVDRFTTMLRNMGNHLSVYNYNPFQIKLVVVAHGPGVKFFMKDLTGSPWEKEQLNIAELKSLEENLLQHGVEYYICRITLQRLKLKEENFHEFVKFVPSGVGAVGELQARGYGYIKVG